MSEGLRIKAPNGSLAMLYCGGALDVMKRFPSGKVQCCVTSPPYFGLRDYGVSGQLGQESLVCDYVKSLISVFQEVRRVLRDDGAVWLNLGDSYAKKKGDGLKVGDLLGLPWEVALALRKDGWYLKQEIIWEKPNAMPERVKRRCTRSHEHLFMLTKKPVYFYNAEAIKEPSVMRPQRRLTKRKDHPKGDSGRPPHRRPEGGTSYKNRNKRSVWTIATRAYRGAHFAPFPVALVEPCILAGSREGSIVLDPFSGTATVGEVAMRLKRHYVGCEINPEYVELSRKRLDAVALQLDDVNQIVVD